MPPKNYISLYAEDLQEKESVLFDSVQKAKNQKTDVLDSQHNPLFTSYNNGAKPAKAPLNTGMADLLDDSLYQAYRDQYDTVDKRLAHLTDVLNDSEDKKKTQGQTKNFVDQLDRAIPSFELAYIAAQKAHKNVDKNNPTAVAATENELRAMKEMHDQLKTLQALAHSQTRITTQQFAENRKAIEGSLKKLGAKSNIQSKLMSAIDGVVKPQLYTDRIMKMTGFGSVPFEKGKNKKSDHDDHFVTDKNARLFNIMEDDKEPGKLNLQMNYNVARALGTHLYGASGGLFGTQKGSIEGLQSRMEDIVTIIINTYNKGSESNPFNPSWTPEKFNRSHEALLGLLIAKQRAIETGQTLLAKDPNDTDPKNPKPLIKINPNSHFTADEQRLFSHFAKQTPSTQGKFGTEFKANSNAAVKLLSGKKGLDGKPLTPEKDMMAAMTGFLNSQTVKSENALKGRLNQAGKHLDPQQPVFTSRPTS